MIALCSSDDQNLAMGFSRELVQSLILDNLCRHSTKYKICSPRPTDRLSVIWWHRHQLWFVNPPILRMLQGTSFWHIGRFLLYLTMWQLNFWRRILLLMFRVLLETKYRRLPVVDDDGKLVSTCTRHFPHERIIFFSSSAVTPSLSPRAWYYFLFWLICTNA